MSSNQALKLDIPAKEALFFIHLPKSFYILWTELKVEDGKIFRHLLWMNGFGNGDYPFLGNKA
ncbi:hypothetical protein HMPREF9176_1295 [Streptococcus downei F0415]|nr:hypothetical protein HMPREF9176_1295 [Streptococcus downei F0415]